MQDKMTSLITKIKLDASTEAYTFHDEEVCPTYINFFFGKNGAGKSSIADAFRNGRRSHRMVRKLLKPETKSMEN